MKESKPVVIYECHDYRQLLQVLGEDVCRQIKEWFHKTLRECQLNIVHIVDQGYPKILFFFCYKII